MFTTLLSSVHTGPGLAIRVICQSEAFLQPDFNTTNSILTLLAGFSQACHASSPGIKELLQLLTAEDQETLYRISSVQPLFATLLPIHTVGVQVCGWVWQVSHVTLCVFLREMVGLIIMLLPCHQANQRYTGRV